MMAIVAGNWEEANACAFKYLRGAPWFHADHPDEVARNVYGPQGQLTYFCRTGTWFEYDRYREIVLDMLQRSVCAKEIVLDGRDMTRMPRFPVGGIMDPCGVMSPILPSRWRIT